MLDEVRDRLALVTELKHGIQAGELTLRYQPIRDLARGRTVAGEALVRWNHPRLGVLPPDMFISIAEETGAIVDLGRWVLEQACRDCAAWRALGADVRVSVNVSGRQLLEPDIVQIVSSALATADLPAKHLVVEITESVLIEDEGVTLKLQQLRALGVLVAVDDFGSGYSSIGYLNKFPLDILKIDRAFVTRCGDGARGRLLESIVQLGQGLGLVAVAEGVETDADEDAVKRAHCDFGQGFLLSRPSGWRRVRAAHPGRGCRQPGCGSVGVADLLRSVNPDQEPALTPGKTTWTSSWVRGLRSREALVAFAAALAAAAYFPLNVPRGSPDLLLGSLEEGLPVVPVLAVPYLLILPVFWALVVRGLVAPGQNERSRNSFRVFLVAALIAFVVSDLVFLAFPTVVPRPSGFGGVMAGLLQWIYDHDNRFNDLPSGHAAMATLLFLYARSLRTRVWRWAEWGLAVCALVATLLLRQHSVWGAAAGVVLASSAWWMARRVWGGRV